MIALGQRDMLGEPVRVPTQPPIDGFPLWAQVLVTLIFGIAALAVAFKGYFQRDSTKSSTVEPADKQTTAILAASIADMGAIRHLSDVSIRLIGSVDKLTDAVEEHTHHARIGNDLGRESCQRLRELVEELERQGRESRAWDRRDEERR